MWSLGNNIYALLTGLEVFQDVKIINNDYTKVQKKIVDGELPFDNNRYRMRSFAERELVIVMKKCWVYDQDERVDIFEVVRTLRDAVERNSELP